MTRYRPPLRHRYRWAVCPKPRPACRLTINDRYQAIVLRSSRPPFHSRLTGRTGFWPAAAVIPF